MSTIKDYSVDHLAGMQVGTSTIIKELARGGMAIVFIAFQRTLKRQIAVKLLPKSLLTPETADLFHQEAEAAAILSHPNIIPVYEVGETDEFLFFTMQLVQGDPLSHSMKMAKKNPIPSNRLLPLPKTIKIVTQVLDALHYAHSQDIVHRDIKPGNIMIEKHNDRPLVMDFGLVKVLRENSDKKSAVHGTPLYMPPEQILSRNVDGRADIYAVGTMLFQMVVDKLPLPKFKSKPALLKHKVLNKEEDMDRIMLKAIAHNPAQRYADCREFREDLEEYQKQYVF
jgi:serine/threonine-protein kinase